MKCAGAGAGRMGRQGAEQRAAPEGLSKGARAEQRAEQRAERMIGKLFKLVFLLAVLGLAGLAAYAWLGDLSPQMRENTLTVTLDAG